MKWAILSPHPNPVAAVPRASNYLLTEIHLSPFPGLGLLGAAASWLDQQLSITGPTCCSALWFGPIENCEVFMSRVSAGKSLRHITVDILPIHWIALSKPMECQWSLKGPWGSKVHHTLSCHFQCFIAVLFIRLLSVTERSLFSDLTFASSFHQQLPDLQDTRLRWKKNVLFCSSALILFSALNFCFEWEHLSVSWAKALLSPCSWKKEVTNTGNICTFLCAVEEQSHCASDYQCF